jgi:hypothetical protein
MASRFVDALAHPSQRAKVDGKRTEDTCTRWLVQKRTYFKGNYDRVLTVAESSIATQMPNLQVTNLYTLSPEFSVKSVTLEKDCITLQARPTGKVRAVCRNERVRRLGYTVQPTRVLPRNRLVRKIEAVYDKLMLIGFLSMPRLFVLLWCNCEQRSR